MKLFKIIILLIISHHAYAVSYQYEVRNTNSRIIHVVTLNPQNYEIKLIKAHNKVFGRETVSRIAERENAEIAINSGFFEIGGERDGMPSATMVAEGRIFGLTPLVKDQLIISRDKISIESRSVTLSASLGDKKILISKYNKFPEKNDVVLYTDTFGDTTLTNYKDRYEASFDKGYKLIKLHEHGNIEIPRGGYVLSLPASMVEPTSIVRISNNDPLLLDNKISIVTGIPLLVSNGIINDKISKQSSDFYNKAHARTALGLKASGEIVLVIAEHAYKKDLSNVTMAELRSVIQESSAALAIKYKKLPNSLTLDELKEIVRSAYTATEGTTGLTILELADLMAELGCHSAINLDGGGSSTLWLEGRIIGQTIGDKDEGLGKVIQRPVSDAIVFRKKAIIK